MFTTEKGGEAAVNHQSFTMKVHHTLTCFFLLSLLDGNTVHADPSLFVYAPEGGDVIVRCSFDRAGNSKFLCRDECKEEDIIIETTNNTAQSGRYRIQYYDTYTRQEALLTVTIINVTKSDSGIYRCGLKSYWTFWRTIEINVEDAFLDVNPPQERTLYAKTGQDIVVACPSTPSGRRKFFCKDECEQDILIETCYYADHTNRYSIRYVKGPSAGGSLFVSITQLNESDSGRYSCGADRPLQHNHYRVFTIHVSDDPAASKRESVPPKPGKTPSLKPPGVLLYVVVILAVVVIILGLALTTICIQRNCKPDGSRTVGNSGTGGQIGLYENCSPVSAGGDSTYETLDPATRDQDQTYSTVTDTQQT